MYEKRYWVGVLVALSLQSCVTYYEINRDFNTAFEQGELEKAEKVLNSKKKIANGKERFLYLVNQGVVLSMQGRYEESNDFFEQAYIYTEDYQVNYLNEATALITNPNAVAYKGEDHERLLLLYYKALNYLQLRRYDEALVECRRLNIRLQQLSDRYESDNKYKQDAFIHTLMGIIYDAAKDYNNAFIAYRNAYSIYQEDYTRLFELSAPTQLKKDILRTAYLTGFNEEYNQFKEEFDMTDYIYEPADGQLVFFWNNGLGPYKNEWSINFAVVEGEGGIFNFTNDEYQFSFPFPVPKSEKPEDHTRLTDLEFFRVAFPKYVERAEFYTQAHLEMNDSIFTMELAENVNAIAFKTLRERMVLEFSKSLLRVALKKATEKQVEKESEGLGLAVSFLNTITEKADTRNWQTLPHSIHYSRVPLKEGMNELTLNLKATDDQGDKEYNFTYDVRKGETAVQAFYSLEYQYSY